MQRVELIIEQYQRVVDLTHLRFPPTQRIGIRGDFVGTLHQILKAFDGFLQIVVVAGIDDSLALDGIALGKLFPQFIDGEVPDDIRDIHRLARFGPPRVVDKEETA